MTRSSSANWVQRSPTRAAGDQRDQDPSFAEHLRVPLDGKQADDHPRPISGLESASRAGSAICTAPWRSRPSRACRSALADPLARRPGVPPPARSANACIPVARKSWWQAKPLRTSTHRFSRRGPLAVRRDELGELLAADRSSEAIRSPAVLESSTTSGSLTKSFGARPQCSRPVSTSSARRRRELLRCRVGAAGLVAADPPPSSRFS